MTDSLAPTHLQGFGVQLAPLSLSHADALVAASADGELWRLNYTTVPGPDLPAVIAYIESALRAQAAGEQLPFVVMDGGGTLLGCSRYYDIESSVPTLAIGYTWYRASMQRTRVNSACKRLLLEHAFDALGMRTVYFHTSHENLRSQAAIERLGAQRDGVIRQHKRHKDGALRDTVCYSILDREWPAIRDRLDQCLQSPRLAGSNQS